eukprot:3783383-Rhodomonas_salina.1
MSVPDITRRICIRSNVGSKHHTVNLQLQGSQRQSGARGAGSHQRTPSSPLGCSLALWAARASAQAGDP